MFFTTLGGNVNFPLHQVQLWQMKESNVQSQSRMNSQMWYSRRINERHWLLASSSTEIVAHSFHNISMFDDVKQ